MEISGKIIVVQAVQSGTSRSGNEWKKQEYVLETHEQYPKKVCFSVFGDDRIKQYDIKKDEEITITFDIDAREYNGRWYNDIKVWKVEKAAAAQTAPAAQPTTPENAVPSSAPIATPEAPVAAPEAPNLEPQSSDDLPF